MKATKQSQTENKSKNSGSNKSKSGVSIIAKSSGIQTKLTIGQPNDKYEQEADRIADQVMMMPAPPTIQRKCTNCEKEEQIQKKPNHNLLQLKVQSNASSVQNSALENKLNSSKSGGNLLPKTTRSFMENGIGADFSNVKIHTDSNAIQMNQELGAQAFAHGNHVYFNSGKYNPSSSQGKHLLAHELVHTVQQARNSKSQISKFAHPFHYESTIKGFSNIGKDDPEKKYQLRPKEIGMISAANFERDFSQTGPLVAEMVLSWKSLKLNGNKTDALKFIKYVNESKKELLTLLTFLSNNPSNPKKAFLKFKKTTRLLTKSYEGGNEITHFDQPDNKNLINHRWKKSKYDPLPAYMKNSRAYIKYNLARAALSHNSSNTYKDRFIRAMAWMTPRERKVFNKLSEAKQKKEIVKFSNRKPSWKSATKNVRFPSNVIIREAMMDFELKDRNPLLASRISKKTADYLGRAAHALEDFYAHSNFVELTFGIAKSDPKAINSQLMTGTFDGLDMLYAGIHKIKMLTDEVFWNKKNMHLLESLVPNAPANIAYLQALLGDNEMKLIKYFAKPTSHTLLAKDDPSESAAAKLALKLAASANAYVFSPIIEGMLTKGKEGDHKLILQSYDKVDQILSKPTKERAIRILNSEGKEF